LIDIFSSGGPFFVFSMAGLFPWQCYIQKDAKRLSTDHRQLLQEKINKLTKKLGIQKEIELIEIEAFYTSLQALGSNVFPNKAGIAIDPNLLKEMPFDMQEFVLAHELSHIKNNDLIKVNLYAGIVAAIVTAVAGILFPSLNVRFSKRGMALSGYTSPAAIIGSFVGLYAFVFFSKKYEEAADKMAFSVCSKEAQLEGINFFKICQEYHISNRKEIDSLLAKIWNKMMYTSEGDFRLDILHPSLSKRIQYLQLELSKYP